MAKINSLDELRRIRQKLEGNMRIREMGDSPERTVQIRVAMATCGIAAGAREVMNELMALVERHKVQAVVTQGGCMGYCYAEPTVEVKVLGKDPVVFGHVDAAVAAEIVEKYILRGELPEGLIIPDNYRTINQ